MINYAQMVKICADEDSPYIFGNSSLEHSVVIGEEMFKKATEYIYILSGKLSEIYYKKNLIEHLKNAAKRLKEESIKIITVEEKDDEKVNTLKIDIEKINENLKKNVFKYLPFKNLKEPESITHFWIVDGKIWRMEEPHDEGAIEKGRIKAQVCFNNEDVGKALKKRFDALWQKQSRNII